MGLTQNEAKIYLYLLKIGKGKLTSLAKGCQFNHVTTLNNLKRLLDKSLIHKDLDGKTKVYYIANPRQGVRQYLQILERDLQKKKMIADELSEWLDLQYRLLSL